MSEKAKKARFWVYANGGFVRLELLPGRYHHHTSFRYTEEGFEKRTRRWHHDGTHIIEESYQRSRDCDGLMEWWDSRSAKVEELSAFVNEEFAPGLRQPLWRHNKGRQRDHAAEAMNY